ncbi:hypothetical protein ALC57_17345, partial [Trachymyrmex cornetzi]
ALTPGGIVTTAAHAATELAVPERRFRTTAGRGADRRCPRKWPKARHCEEGGMRGRNRRGGPPSPPLCPVRCSHCIAITRSVKRWIIHRVNDLAENREKICVGKANEIPVIRLTNIPGSFVRRSYVPLANARQISRRRRRR